MYILRKESLYSDQYHWNEQLPLTSNRWTDEKDQDILYVHFSASRQKIQWLNGKGQKVTLTIIYKTLHRKHNTWKQESHNKPVVNSGIPKRYSFNIHTRGDPVLPFRITGVHLRFLVGFVLLDLSFYVDVL
jgi:hypothetical protein